MPLYGSRLLISFGGNGVELACIALTKNYCQDFARCDGRKPTGFRPPISLELDCEKLTYEFTDSRLLGEKEVIRGQ